VQLTELLSPERIKIPLVSSTKDEILAELVEVVARNTPVRDRGDVLRAVREREEVLSTGIGAGVAIPHGKSSAVADLARTYGSLLPVEIKTSRRVTSSDAAHLRLFRSEYPDRSRAGLILYDGDETEWLAKDVLAAPWWRVVRADGRLLPGHERRALEHYRAENTALRDERGGGTPRLDMRRARWDGVS
jgi:hypothetical protein